MCSDKFVCFTAYSGKLSRCFMCALPNKCDLVFHESCPIPSLSGIWLYKVKQMALKSRVVQKELVYGRKNFFIHV